MNGQKQTAPKAAPTASGAYIRTAEAARVLDLIMALGGADLKGVRDELSAEGS